MKQTVDIKLHPLAWQVLKQQYKYDGIAVDLGKSWLYKVFVASLRRHPVVAPWEFSRMPQGLVDGRVYITDYDFQRYGGHMGIAKQLNFSMIVTKRERERLCLLTAAAHVLAEVSRDTAMRYFLEKEAYREEEISFATLRKHYQRHYRHFEDTILHDLKELSTQKPHKRTQKFTM